MILETCLLTLNDSVLLIKNRQLDKDGFIIKYNTDLTDVRQSKLSNKYPTSDFIYKTIVEVDRSEYFLISGKTFVLILDSSGLLLPESENSKFSLVVQDIELYNYDEPASYYLDRLYESLFLHDMKYQPVDITKSPQPFDDIFQNGITYFLRFDANKNHHVFRMGWSSDKLGGNLVQVKFCGLQITEYSNDFRSPDSDSNKLEHIQAIWEDIKFSSFMDDWVLILLEKI